MPRRILIFGGTFDPPHRAHLTLAASVARSLACDRIRFVPAARNPLKADTPFASDEHRLAMLRLAIRSVPEAEIATLELDRGGASYFVETLDAFRAEDDAAELLFVIGAGHAVDFRRWHEWERILAIATPVVLLRPPWDRERLHAVLMERHDASAADEWMSRVIEAPRLDVSATKLRAILAAGQDPGDALDPDVAAYIATNGLYLS